MNLWHKFWTWYERYYLLNVGIAAVLFALQLVHLYWLSADVVSSRLTGHSHFELTGIWHTLVLLIDYTEIPAILSTSLVYINEFRQGRKLRGLLYLFFINSQFLHIYWITDEFVVEQFTSEVNWGAEDFIAMSILLFGMGSLFVGIARVTPRNYRVLVGAACVAVLFLFWVHLAVGIVDTWPLAGS